MSREESKSLFPSECLECTLVEGDSGDSQLCPFCRELRINHVLRCLEPKSSWPIMTLGSLEEISIRNKCSFCLTIQQTIEFALIARRKPCHNRAESVVLLDLTRFTPREGHLIQAGYFVIWVKVHFEEDQNGITTPLLVRRRGGVATGASNGIQQSYPANLLRDCLDWNKVKSWLAYCLSHHDHYTKKSLRSHLRQPYDFKLVNILKQCVVAAPSGSQYIALSYVWGHPGQDDIQATKSAIETLEQPGSLSRTRIPTTIKDAMALCSRLDVRYLWVDSLCILQDDDTHKHSQINSMDDIYSSALLTICAAAGDDADAGLKGLETSPRAFCQRPRFTSALELIPILPAFEHYKVTKWASRGWTYQEHLLSKRVLLFTPWQVFFQCDKGILAEGISDQWMPLMADDDLNSDDGEDNNAAEHSTRTSSSSFNSYMEHVASYNHRSLTYPADVHNAFAGIFKRLYRTLDASVASLPAPHFDRALLWSHDASVPPALRRVDDDDDDDDDAVALLLLPSWSWTRLSTKITYTAPSTIVDRNRIFASLVAWFLVEPPPASSAGASPSLKPITPAPDQAAWDRCDVDTFDALVSGWPSRLRSTGIVSGFDGALARLYVDAAMALGCVESVAGGGKRRPESWAEVQRGSVERWKDHGAWWEDVVKKGVQEKMEDGVKRGGVGGGLRAGQLVCRAGVLWVDVEKVGGERGQWEDLLLLRDRKGRVLGTVNLPKVSGCAVGLDNDWDEGRFAVMALSVTDADGDFLDSLFEADASLGSLGLDCHGRRMEGSPDVTILDMNDVPLVPSPALNVMMLGWKGGVAHRVAVGKVLLTRWAEAEPEFKNITLD